MEKQNKVKSSAKAKSANFKWLLCIVQGGYIKFALNYITFFFIMYNKIWFMCLQCAFHLWYASSDAQPIWFSRSFCCRPEVLPVSAGVPVWVHRRCRDRWWGEHRWVQFNKAQSIHLLLRFHLLHHINQIFLNLIFLLCFSFSWENSCCAHMYHAGTCLVKVTCSNDSFIVNLYISKSN